MVSEVASCEGGRGGLLRSSKNALLEKFQARKARETGGLYVGRWLEAHSFTHPLDFFHLNYVIWWGLKHPYCLLHERGVGSNNSQRGEGINFAGERGFLTFPALRCPGILALKGKRRKKTEERFAWRKLSGGWAAAHSSV